MELLGESDRPEAGAYRLLAELGRGGMGRVLLGAAPDGRLVAVKLVRWQFAEDEGFRVRFRREVEASRRVSGAYTAAVVDADVDAPLPWLASVFVPGPSLQQVMDTVGPLPAEETVRLAAGLAAALVGIHRAGLIHRDLKPSNVLLAADGPRVIDFGIARATDSEGGTEMTHTGWLVGSPAFMSPEQAEGRDLTPASDVFSLGTVLVLACTGVSPFAGPSTPQTLYRVVHTEPDLTQIPDQLRDLVARCLEKDPSRRPSPAGILESLGQLAPSERPWPAAVHALIDEQHAGIARMLGLPADSTEIVESETETVVRTLPGTGGTREERPAAAPPADPGAETETAVPAAPVPPPAAAAAHERWRPKRRTLLLGALGVGTAAVAVPLGVSMSKDPGGEDAGASRKPAPSPSRSASRSYSPTADPNPQFTMASAVGEGYPSVVKFSPDGKRIAIGDSDGRVWMVHSPTLEPAAELGGPSTVQHNGVKDLAFSPDGKLLASCEEYTTLWSTTTHEKAAILRDAEIDPVAVESLAFSPDGSILACGNWNGTITLWNVSSRKKIATLVDPVWYTENADKEINCVRFTARGRTLVASTAAGKLRFWDVGKRKTTTTVEASKKTVNSIAFSPDGSVLAGVFEGDIHLWDARTLKRTGSLTFTEFGNHNGLLDEIVNEVVFSPDGKTLASSVWGGMIQFWDVETREVVLRRNQEGKGVSSIDLSPDGTLLVACLGVRELGLWMLPPRYGDG